MGDNSALTAFASAFSQAMAGGGKNGNNGNNKNNNNNNNGTNGNGNTSRRREPILGPNGEKLCFDCEDFQWCRNAANGECWFHHRRNGKMIPMWEAGQRPNNAPDILVKGKGKGKGKPMSQPQTQSQTQNGTTQSWTFGDEEPEKEAPK
jgi:hypothetical protein